MEPTIILKTRRQFLRQTALGAAVTWTVPHFLARTFAALQNAADANAAAAAGRDGTILVVLQMAGGNDGLNTVIPFANDYYRKARPTIGIDTAKVLKLDSDFAFHPGLADFADLFQASRLSVIHGVGYPNPNRSHFRSTEIWQTASDSNKPEKYGWLGRYFDNACKGADPTVGVNIGRQMPQAFSSAHPLGVSLENPDNYRFASGGKDEDGEMNPSEKMFRQLNRTEMLEDPDTSAGASIGSLSGKVVHPGSALDFLERTAMDAQVSSDQILAISKHAKNEASYPASPLGNSLKLIARLIGGGLGTRVYYASQGGYDTHTNQAPTQERLLKDLGGSLAAFIKDMQAQSNAERVLVMTFSEFGRRVTENANRGTDHGAAAPIFVAGPSLKERFIGKHPSLAPNDLMNGDLKFSTDFRSVYATLLEKWLKTASSPILGRQFELLPFV